MASTGSSSYLCWSNRGTGGSGKSLVADMFAARGAALIDTDLIAHRLTAPGG
ncbi:MAG: dephospho-CoA kinase, partial [Noviherbaspirillum sp.]